MKCQIHLLVEQVMNIHKNIFTLISDRKPYDFYTIFLRFAIIKNLSEFSTLHFETIATPPPDRHVYHIVSYTLPILITILPSFIQPYFTPERLIPRTKRLMKFLNTGVKRHDPGVTVAHCSNPTTKPLQAACS